MQNIFETVFSLFKEHVIEEPKIPLHTGEVTNIWIYYTFLDEAKRFSQLAMNHTDTKEVLHLLEDIIFNLEDPQIMKIREFMKTNGIPLPDVTAQKIPTDPSAVPVGAKLTDSEIMNSVALKISTAITLLATGIAQSVRDDVGIMFASFFAQKLMYGSKIKQIMKKHDWLKVPPYYYAPGIPIQKQ